MTDDNDISPTDLLRLTQPAEPEAYDPIPLPSWTVAGYGALLWA